MKIGYIRVSTQEQNTIRQEVLMESLGVDEIYIDRMSGKDTNRPELQKMMNYVRHGDTVIVESISRFARNTRDLLELVERLAEKGVEFISKKEAIDTTTPTGKFMLTVFGAVAELEREYILQRQREGITIAKAQGKYTACYRRGVVRISFRRLLSARRRLRQAESRKIFGFLGGLPVAAVLSRNRDPGRTLHNKSAPEPRVRYGFLGEGSALCRLRDTGYAYVVVRRRHNTRYDTHCPAFQLAGERQDRHL